MNNVEDPFVELNETAISLKIGLYTYFKFLFQLLENHRKLEVNNKISKFSTGFVSILQTNSTPVRGI